VCVKRATLHISSALAREKESLEKSHEPGNEVINRGAAPEHVEPRRDLGQAGFPNLKEPRLFYPPICLSFSISVIVTLGASNCLLMMDKVQVNKQYQALNMVLTKTEAKDL
jgi:hypothetical protein